MRFYSECGKILHFVDTRRFGRWNIGSFSSSRGPGDWFFNLIILNGFGDSSDPVQDFDKFKKNILDSLDKKIFDNPICEVMLDQKYFNGIGNYLRAEILFRAKCPPFISARDAILKKYQKQSKSTLDLLTLCKGNSEMWKKKNDKKINTFFGDATKEVIELDERGGSFQEWLKCYGNKNLSKMVDSKKRTIWFQGDSGNLVPKINVESEDEETSNEEENVANKKRQRKSRTVSSKRRKMESPSSESSDSPSLSESEELDSCESSDDFE